MNLGDSLAYVGALVNLIPTLTETHGRRLAHARKRTFPCQALLGATGANHVIQVTLTGPTVPMMVIPVELGAVPGLGCALCAEICRPLFIYTGDSGGASSISWDGVGRVRPR